MEAEGKNGTTDAGLGGGVVELDGGALVAVAEVEQTDVGDEGTGDDAGDLGDCVGEVVLSRVVSHQNMGA